MHYDTNNLYVADIIEGNQKTNSYFINNVLLYKIADGIYVDFSRAELFDERYMRTNKLDEDLIKLNNYFKDPEKYKKYSKLLNENYIIKEYGDGLGSCSIDSMSRLDIRSEIVDFDKIIYIYEKFSKTPTNHQIII